MSHIELSVPMRPGGLPPGPEGEGVAGDGLALGTPGENETCSRLLLSAELPCQGEKQLELQVYLCSDQSFQLLVRSAKRLAALP